MKPELEKLKIKHYTPKQRELRYKHFVRYYGWKINQERHRERQRQTTSKEAI